MRTLAQSAYLDSEFGVEQELPHAGSALENPFVFDATARELHEMAPDGPGGILHEGRRARGGGSPGDRLTFKRVR